MTVKYTAADGRLKTHESKRGPERGAWTPLLSGAVGLTVTVSRRRGVLGRRSAAPINVNGGQHE